jgi:DNA-binding PadR family transcriptional regulator
MDNKPDLTKEIPLTEATFFILLSLAPGAKHGYGIMQEAEQLSDGRLKLSTGTLYGAIKRLLEIGWIEKVEHPEEGAPPRERRLYQLSDIGRSILKAETERLEQLVIQARQIAPQTLQEIFSHRHIKLFDIGG